MSSFFLVIITFFVLCEPAFAQARFPFTGETVSDRVHVRAGQNNNFESVALLSKGTELVVLGKNFSWYKVFLPEGAKAFVKSGYVKLLTADIAEVLVDHLNVRSGPNTEATTLGQLKQGQKFFIDQIQGDWIRIKPVEGVYGWVNETLLVFKNESVSGKVGKTPDVVAAAREQEKRAQEARQSAKTALLKKFSNDIVECSGVLVSSEGAVKDYKILHDKVTVCYVDGPQPVLNQYVGSSVSVRGRLESVPLDSDAGVVLLSKINLDI
jgi:SH3-like domain-containing protein